MCNSCEVLNINGVKCHEIGYPVAWKDYDRECAWCGNTFKPETEHQKCCGDNCGEAYNG